MSGKDNKMGRFKNHLIRLQEKIQDHVEDFQDQLQSKIEKSKLSKLVSHLSTDKSSLDDSAGERELTDYDKTSSDSPDLEVRKGLLGISKSVSIPCFVVDEPNVHKEPKDLCKDFIKVERDEVLYRRCVSTSNLAREDESNLHSSCGSCSSCLSFSSERNVEMRPRSGSLPPGTASDLPTPSNTCSELIEKIGNHFPGLKGKGESFHRVLTKKICRELQEVLF